MSITAQQLLHGDLASHFATCAQAFLLTQDWKYFDVR